MKRVVIFSAAEIRDYDSVKKNILPGDFIIACDGGLFHLEKLGIKPDLVTGDFDSHEKPSLDVEIIALPCEKDDTDTFFAVKEAVKRGFKDFLLCGVIGQRLDHTFGNLSVLIYLDQLNLSAKIIDDYGEMSLASKNNPVSVPDCFKYFSVINLDGTPQNITIQNAKYPLSDAQITCGYQYGISNEPLPGKKSVVSVKEGRVLVIKIK